MLSIGRAAERVDRLVVVADDGHVPVPLGERRDELGLGAVRVLELVDEDVPEAARRSRAGRPATSRTSRSASATWSPKSMQPFGGHQLLVASRRPARARPAGARSSPSGIGRVGAAHLAAAARHGRGLGRDAVRVGEVVGRRDVLVLAAAEQRRQRRQEPGRVAERPVDVEVELEQVLAQEDDDLGAGQHAEIGRQPELEGVLADEPVAERVERARSRVSV